MNATGRFADSLREASPPETLPPPLLALWLVGRGEWDRAHAIVAGHEGEPDCDLVHAHLHRREGDDANARYWYRRSGEPASTLTLEAEWRLIAARLLERTGAALD